MHEHICAWSDNFIRCSLMFISWCVFKNTLCEDLDNSYSYSNSFLEVNSLFSMAELQQSSMWHHSSISRKYLLISHGWIWFQAESSKVSWQGESLIQYSHFVIYVSDKKKWLNRNFVLLLLLALIIVCIG